VIIYCPEGRFLFEGKGVNEMLERIKESTPVQRGEEAFLSLAETAWGIRRHYEDTIEHNGVEEAVALMADGLSDQRLLHLLSDLRSAAGVVDARKLGWCRTGDFLSVVEGLVRERGINQGPDDEDMLG